MDSCQAITLNQCGLMINQGPRVKAPQVYTKYHWRLKKSGHQQPWFCPESHVYSKTVVSMLIWSNIAISAWLGLPRQISLATEQNVGAFCMSRYLCHAWVNNYSVLQDVITQTWPDTCMEQADIQGKDKYLHPQYYVRCNYLSMP